MLGLKRLSVQQCGDQNQGSQTEWGGTCIDTRYGAAFSDIYTDAYRASPGSARHEIVYRIVGRVTLHFHLHQYPPYPLP
jgi:hypothetical protein